MQQLYARPGHLTVVQTRQALGISAGALRNLVLRKKLTRSGGSARYPEFAAADVAAIAANRRDRQSA
ncbi:hypothetical protein [Streptomyces sp. NPDC101455]|uniref:hypothetical protein n=1 Tax=Streptomyces sp. NPDC101455 TaxID=3366142 RepID=UPI003810DB59